PSVKSFAYFFIQFSCYVVTSVNQPGSRRLFQGLSQRAVFLTCGARYRGNAAQMVLRLITIALFDLPQAVILPCPHMVRIGLERALVPDLRQLVVAELAIGVADQIRDIGAVFMAERLQLLDGGSKIVAVVDRGIGGAIAGSEALLLDGRRLLAFLLSLLAAVAGRLRWRRLAAAASGKSRG